MTWRKCISEFAAPPVAFMSVFCAVGILCGVCAWFLDGWWTTSAAIMAVLGCFPGLVLRLFSAQLVKPITTEDDLELVSTEAAELLYPESTYTPCREWHDKWYAYGIDNRGNLVASYHLTLIEDATFYYWNPTFKTWQAEPLGATWLARLFSR